LFWCLHVRTFWSLFSKGKSNALQLGSSPCFCVLSGRYPCIVYVIGKMCYPIGR
jgi:hypothetical protein